MDLFIVAPLSSGHVQQWYSKFDASGFNEILVFTVHNKTWEFINENANVSLVNCGYTRTRFDFIILYLAVFFLSITKNNLVINCHFMSSYGLSSIVARADKKLLSCWGSDVNKVKTSKFVRFLYRVAINQYDWINVPSLDMKLKLKQYLDDVSKVHVFQYGVDFENIPVKLENEFSCLKPMRFVSNRNWQPLYNIDNIILAFSDFVEKTGVIHELHIFGSGSPSDIKRVKKLVSGLSHGVKSCVFIHGYMEKYEMLDKMTSFDCFVSLPNTDGLPLSLLESMYIGLLPLVIRLPVYEEWLSKEQAVFVNTAEVKSIVQGFLEACEMAPFFSPEVNRGVVKKHGGRDENVQKLYKALLS